MPRRRELPYDPQRLSQLEETGHEVLDLGQFGDHYDAVVDAVEKLPYPYRRIIECLFWERVPLRKLGAEMRLDESTIRYHKNRALGLLREELACILESTSTESSTTSTRSPETPS